ncbi:MAG: beta-hydroxyacyl-ACP dehydratase [Verrucomicrobiales bacterium]|nr:beta-hydroxyacyl-ACP dehydratase [Verrucomicrobiales bacterium]
MSPNLQQALAALPHGAAFRFLDRLTELDPGRSGSAEYTLRGDETFLTGHFPGQPLMPGVLMVEAAAQLAGVVAQSDPALPPLQDLRLTAIRTAKITGTARPGQTLRLHAEIVGRLGGLVQARTQAVVEEGTVLSAELVLSGTP